MGAHRDHRPGPLVGVRLPGPRVLRQLRTLVRPGTGSARHRGGGRLPEVHVHHDGVPHPLPHVRPVPRRPGHQDLRGHAALPAGLLLRDLPQGRQPAAVRGEVVARARRSPAGPEDGRRDVPRPVRGLPEPAGRGRRRGGAVMIEGFRGTLIEPGDPGYEPGRRVFNHLVDKRPAFIARCFGPADVVAVLRHARDTGLPVAVRAGGHSVAGHGTCDGGALIDLSPMRGVHVDPTDATAWVQGGATPRDVGHETQLYGLALPSGQVSKTGVAGLTLNGGLGMLQRKYGLTCDNLIEARMVTATGELVVASEETDPDLLWALRGGGGNFGVVTSFRYRLHRVGPLMLAGLVGYPLERATDVLAFLRDLIADAPEELSADAIFLTAPPMPFIPEEWQGKPLVGIFVRWCGDVERGYEVVRPIQEFGPPA